MPYAIEQLLPEGKTLPKFLNEETGKYFWAAFFSFVLVFPCSLPRTLSALRFSSMASFFISIFIILSIVFLGLVDKDVNSNNGQTTLGASFKTGITNFDITVSGVFNSLPLVIFAFMYQPNIPMIYSELEKKSRVSMTKVLNYGTIGASVSYLMAGVFGYVTFANYPNVDEIMEMQNILQAPYQGNVIIYICLFAILIVILFATPLTLLPCKDTLEELLLPPNQTFSFLQNALVTFVLVVISYLFAILIPNKFWFMEIRIKNKILEISLLFLELPQIQELAF